MRRKALADITPLRESPSYRLLFAASLLSTLAGELVMVGVSLLVFERTRSSFAVGMLGPAMLGPLLVGAVTGGELADRKDRLGIATVASAGGVVCTGALAANAAADRPVLAVVYVGLAIAAGLAGFGRPASDALTPTIVRPELLPAAGALAGLAGSAGMIGGPALAGGIIALGGVASAIAAGVAAHVAALACLLAARRHVPRRAPDPGAAPTAVARLRSAVDGVRYLRGKPILQGTYLVDFVAMVFGMPLALFPALAVERFHSGKGSVGLLYAAPAVGAALASATSGWVGRVHRVGAAIIGGALVWGLAIVGFGLATSLPLALGMLVVAGAGDMISGVFRMTIWGREIDDDVRGRLAGLTLVNVNAGPMLGDAEAGAVASWRSPQFSVVSGGLACVVGVLVCAAALPAFRTHRFEAVSDDLMT